MFVWTFGQCCPSKGYTALPAPFFQTGGGKEGDRGAQPAKAEEEEYPQNQKADLNLTLIILFMEMISSYTCLFMQSMR